MKSPYEDIINLPHHVSDTRPQMSMKDRAAQFSPFAALTGYDTAIKETERLIAKREEKNKRDERDEKDERHLHIKGHCKGEKRFP